MYMQYMDHIHKCSKIPIMHLCVLIIDFLYLDEDLVGLGWGYLNLLNHQWLVRLPGHCCLALDDLEGSNKPHEFPQHWV